MSANVIQEYLVSLGFGINNPELAQFNRALNDAANSVNAATGGMARELVTASTTMVTALATVTMATGGLLHSLAEADMGYQKLALNMWTSNQNAKSLKTTLT